MTMHQSCCSRCYRKPAMVWVSLQLFALATTIAMIMCWENCWGFPTARAFVIDTRSEVTSSSGSYRRKDFDHACDKRRFQSPTFPFPTLLLPQSLSTSSVEALPPRVWIEEAEEGFVDEDENLESGEICIRSVKSFASGVPSDGASNNSMIRVDFEIREEENGRRFLSAGALVQRPRYNCEPDKRNSSVGVGCLRPDSTGISDAWMADSLLKEGGPNLQLKGALLVLDDMLLHHLQRERENHWSMLEHERNNNYIDSTNGKHQTPGTSNTENQNDDTSNNDDSWAIRALRNFVVHCGDEDNEEELCINPESRPWRSTSHVAASKMAVLMRGFAPLREMVRISSFYDAGYYDGDVTGLVLDHTVGFDRYRTTTKVGECFGESPAESIANLLPSEETVARHTTKRFTTHRQQEGYE